MRRDFSEVALRALMFGLDVFQKSIVRSQAFAAEQFGFSPPSSASAAIEAIAL